MQACQDACVEVKNIEVGYKSLANLKNSTKIILVTNYSEVWTVKDKKNLSANERKQRKKNTSL